ncbi:MAG: hypothetical protein JXB38_21505 [Anaerolineales bacterium]|nr:hypothetical protein [Anaerolineales bacterium]
MKLRNLMLGIILCSLTISASGATKARADIGPPRPPKGSGISPDEETTMVQMLSETVEIEITGKIGIYEAYWEDRNYPGYEALVNASFTMRNQGDAEEQMLVHFPMNLWSFYNGTLIQDFRVLVNGQELDWTTAHYSNSDLTWAIFDVTFPPQKNVNVRV